MCPLPANSEEYTLETREASPAHLLTKIKSFSELSHHKIGILESNEFAAGDYHWKVKINLQDEDEHISVKLSMVGTSSLPAGWEVNAIFNFFLYNHISDKYLCFRGKARRFHAANCEWRFPKLMSKESLREASNGYVFEDKCVFGAEVFVINKQPLIEEMSLLRLSTPFKREWKISKFSKLESIWNSEEFVAGGYKWKLQMYPNGDSRASGRYVSVYLTVADSRILKQAEILSVDFTFYLRSSFDHENLKNHSTKAGRNWYTSATSSLGFSDFIAIGDMKKRGFLVKDSCILGIQIY